MAKNKMTIVQHTKQKKKNSPTEDVKKWIKNFVTVPHPAFGNLPPCPFAQKAIVEKKVEFQELSNLDDFKSIYQRIWTFDFEAKEVLVLIADKELFSATDTEILADELNFRLMSHDIVVLEDHPNTVEKVANVKLNQGTYMLLLVQSLSRLNKFAKMLDSGPYYKKWDKKYLESVRGFREK